MSEQQNAAKAAPIDIDESFFGQLQQANPDNDPRVVRWGYNPGVRGLTLNPRETGIREPYIPVGKFLAHTTFQTPEENCTLDEYKEKEYLVDVTAADSQRKFETALGEWGYRSFFYGEIDVVKVVAINQVLLPTLSEIRELFGDHAPIDAVCKGEDELDFGVGRSHCATCHLKWIKSDACRVLMQEAVENGKTVPVRTPEGEVKERRVKISAEQLETARAHVQAGLEIYIRKANKDWATTITEIENKKRDQIQDAEHYLRKDLHQIKPQNAAIEMVERVTNATTGANSDILAALAKSTMDTNRLLSELVKQGQSGKVAPAAKPAAEPSSEFLGQVCADTTQAGEPCKGRVTKNVDGVFFCSQHPKTQ